ncbi:lipopolysaccharide transport system permease protein/teichoic acid transport system permease protein [Metabacillus crassostreae]|uniref:ABC transporter permease n=1 Tax=Metabacillus crassostreae TaxID=929098 RepID=UPI0019573E06|nr:ABC transporter permease [Metabacillus crassostreae]MBM7606264.1 lipopolysaccharide transport system permease protein/teichoic acid transport system permease protein [Metabacillus crassostreae]
MFIETVKAIKKNKDLIYHLTTSDFKANSSRTYFGFLWWIIDPIFYMAIFYLLVVVILERGGADYPLIIFTGLIPLKFVTASLVDGTNAISSKGNILQQVYVPKVIFLIVRLLVNSIKYIISVVMLFLFLIIYGVDLTWNVLYFPLIFIVNAFCLLGVMIFLAHLGVFIKDVKNVMQYISRVLLYLSPVLFELKDVPQGLLPYLYLNPFTTFLESYRDILIYGRPPEFLPLSIMTFASVFILYLGLRLLNKNEKEYAKVI